MSIRYTDQVHSAVKPSVECEVCGLRINTVFILVAACNCEKILAVFFTKICDVCTEDGIAPFVINGFFAVYINSGLLAGRQDLYINTATF